MTLAWVHQREVARIAALWAELPGGSLVVATGARPELRRAVERALGAAGAPEPRLVPFVSGSPWRAVDALHDATGAPAGAAYSLECPRGDEAFARSLNRVRESILGSRRYVLVWVEGLGELPAFAEAAPDLWSRRDQVGYFLGEGDFEGLHRAPEEAVEALEDRAVRLQGEWERARGAWEGAAWVAADLAVLRYNQGRHEEGLAVVDAALAKSNVGTLARSQLHRLRADLLGDLERHDEARGGLHAAALELEGTDGPLAWGDHWGVTGHAPRALGSFRSAGPLSGSFLWYREALLWSHLGHPSQAVALLRRVNPRPEADLVGVHAKMKLAEHASERGDLVSGLQGLLAATRQMASRGGIDLAGVGAAQLSRDFEHLGLLDEAERWLRRAIEGRTPLGPLHLASARLALATFLWSLPGRESEARAAWAESVATLREALPAAREPMARVRLQIDLVAALSHPAGREAPATGPDPLVEARAALTDASEEHASSPERRGRIAWAEADLAWVTGDYALAAERNAAVLAWMREPVSGVARRGPVEQALLLHWRAEALRRCASSLPPTERREQLALALQVAHEAVRVAARSWSVYRRRDALRARARVLEDLADPAAAQDWRRALAAVRAEGLRPLELGLLHELTERPLAPDASRAARNGRLRAARAALQLARELARPREEARAHHNLARLGDPGAPATRRHRAEALEIARHLGPRDLLATLEAPPP